LDPVTAGVLAEVEKAQRFLASFTGDLPELKEAHTKAAVYVEFFKKCKSGLGAQNLAAELKIRLERKLGEMLPGAVKGRPKILGNRDSNISAAGIEPREATRLRKIAAVPEVELRNYFLEMRGEDKEITSAGVLRLWAALNHAPKAGETVPAEVRPEKSEGVVPEGVVPDFWKSARTCREEVNRCMRKLKDVRLVLSGLMESPYKALLKKSAHGDKAVELAWDGREKLTDLPLGATLVEKVYTCPALDSLIQFVGALKPLFDREADRQGPA
jgi:hypothetical protein